jgi:hypothetical protein
MPQAARLPALVAMPHRMPMHAISAPLVILLMDSVSNSLVVCVCQICTVTEEIDPFVLLAHQIQQSFRLLLVAAHPLLFLLPHLTPHSIFLGLKLKVK